jgi:hypothetical protein
MEFFYQKLRYLGWKMGFSPPSKRTDGVLLIKNTPLTKNTKDLVDRTKILLLKQNLPSSKRGSPSLSR